MYTHLKKSTSMIILASIVATTNMSMFAGYATGPSSDVQTELGGSSLTVGRSRSQLQQIRHSGEPCSDRDLSKEFNDQQKKISKMCKKGEKLIHEFNEGFTIIHNMEQSLMSTCKGLIYYKTGSGKYKKDNKKLFMEQNERFNVKCEELDNQFQKADDILLQIRNCDSEHLEQKKILKNIEKDKFEIEARRYNLDKSEEYNKDYSEVCNAMEEECLWDMKTSMLKLERSRIYLEIEKKYSEFIKQLSVEKGISMHTMEQIKVFENIRLKDWTPGKISKSGADSICGETLCKYLSMRDEYSKLTDEFKKVECTLQGKAISLNRIQKHFEEKVKNLKDEINSLEHTKPKLEVAAIIPEVNDNAREVNTLERGKDIKFSSDLLPELKSCVNESSKEIEQTKIEKSSDYNREKKLRVKGDNKKKKKNSKRGAIKVKNINNQVENSQENAGVFIKAKIVKLDKPKEDVDLRDNDCESTLSNPSEGSNDSTQSDSNSSELSSTGSEGDSKGIDDNNNLEMSDEELREKLAEASKGFDEFIKDSVKLSVSQSDDEFIKSLLGTVEN